MQFKEIHVRFNRSFGIVLLFLLIGAFFWQFIVKGLLPIPADTIVGLYYPFRDLYAANYPNGIPFKNPLVIPFKNPLITDPVRQQYPWRELAVSIIKRGELPLWNPYNLAGTPLLANFQSGVFYPLNALFFILPMEHAWGILIFLEPLLAGIFMYIYLSNLRLAREASLFGAIVFSFCGFFIAWLEWGTVLHTALWLPLILLSIDKVFNFFEIIPRTRTTLVSFSRNKSVFIWSAVFVLSLVFSFFAGHLQTFFYVGIFSTVYLSLRWWQYGKSKKIICLLSTFYFLFAIITAIQWVPTLQFINLSARQVDVDGQRPGWFIPLLLLQFSGCPLCNLLIFPPDKLMLIGKDRVGLYHGSI